MSSKPDALVVPVDPSSPSVPTAWSNARTEKSKKPLDTRIIFEQSGISTLVSLGAEFSAKDANAKRELVRKAVGAGVGRVKELATSAGVKSVEIDGQVDAQAAAVASHLSLHTFTLQTKPDVNPGKAITLVPSAKTDEAEWKRGTIFAKSQILSRELMELPANMLTPTAFCERIQKEFAGVENVEVIVRDAAWAKEQKMNVFLSVAKGSDEPCKFLEIHYKGATSPTARPLAFVGKGITFDSGGISLKPSAGMKLMRGDMGGAAAVCSAALAIAKLKLPINLVIATPLTENLPGPSANKPGDVVYHVNGKTVEIDNTDAEGRLVLSDALWYVSTKYKPHTMIDVATLTGAMVTAVGEIYTGVFSTSETLWSELHKAGEVEFDRFWRMPLDEEYGPQIYLGMADVINYGGLPAGCCTAALFLKSFVDGIESKDGKEPELRWAHLDMAGSMEATRPGPYQAKGMTGRPVRALIEFASGFA